MLLDETVLKNKYHADRVVKAIFNLVYNNEFIRGNVTVLPVDALGEMKWKLYYQSDKSVSVREVVDTSLDMLSDYVKSTPFNYEEHGYDNILTEVSLIIGNKYFNEDTFVYNFQPLMYSYNLKDTLDKRYIKYINLIKVNPTVVLCTLERILMSAYSHAYYINGRSGNIQKYRFVEQHLTDHAMEFVYELLKNKDRGIHFCQIMNLYSELLEEMYVNQPGAWFDTFKEKINEDKDYWHLNVPDQVGFTLGTNVSSTVKDFINTLVSSYDDNDDWVGLPDSARYTRLDDLMNENPKRVTVSDDLQYYINNYEDERFDVRVIGSKVYVGEEVLQLNIENSTFYCTSDKSISESIYLATACILRILNSGYSTYPSNVIRSVKYTQEGKSL